MRRPALLALALSPMLTGCSQSIAGTADQMCRSWLPVWISKADVLTPDTKEQVAGNNAAREAWCGRPPKPTKPNPVTS